MVRTVFLILPIVVAFVLYRVLLAPQGAVLSPPPTKRLDAAVSDRSQIWAYITGGTSGIGKSMAKDLLSRGYSVIITGTSEATVAAALSDLKKGIIIGKQKILGEVLDIFNTDGALAMVEKQLAKRDIRIVIYNIFPEKFTPTYSLSPDQVRGTVNALGVTLVDAVALTTRHWMKTNKTGVFLTGGACSSYATINGGELYTAMRTFQTAFMVRNAETYLSATSRFADDRTRQILLAVNEIPVVDTPLLDKILQRETEAAVAGLNFMKWNSDEYARTVLVRVLDKGESFVTEGYGWRMIRAMSTFITISFGDPHPASMSPGLEI